MSVQWLSQIIDWDKYKLQYEVMGDSLARIAATHGVSLDALQRIADEEGWRCRANDDGPALSHYLVGMVKTSRTKLKLAALMREIELFPSIMEAEYDLLDKVKLAIKDVDPYAPFAHQQLRALGQTIGSIAERKIIDLEDDNDFIDPEKHTWTVEVVEARDSHLTLVESKMAHA